MRIDAIQKTNYCVYDKRNQKPKINFSGWERNVYHMVPKAGVDYPLSVFPKYRNNTWLLRGGDEIPRIIDSVVKINEDVSHVNTRIYGCSNGAESYSMYMSLASRYGKDIVSKFSPFRAMDIDEYAISIAKSGELPIDYEEFLNIQIFTHNKFNEFFDGKKYGVPDGYFNPFVNNAELEKIFTGRTFFDGNSFETGRRFCLNKDHINHIEYSVADITKDCENIEYERTFLSARNMLPYLDDDDILRLITVLGKRLPQDSCIALGSYDLVPVIDRNYSFDLLTILEDNGFIRDCANSEFLFRKL